MLRVHDDGVLIIIDIRRILEAPWLAVDRDRHDAKILPRRVRNRARVAYIFDAEQALRITGRLFQLCRRDIARVFLRLGQVDGDFQLTVLRVRNPMLILCDAVAADIVAVLTQLIEIIRRRFRTFLIQAPEFSHHFRRCRRHAAHETSVKQVALRNGVRDHSLLRRIIAEDVQTFRKTMAFYLFFVAFEFQFRQKRISRKRLIQRVQEVTVLRIAQQRVQRRIDTSYHI